MNSMKAPKFGKVELLIKDKKDPLSTTKIDFDDCGLMITGDYLIVIIDEKDEMNHTLTSTGKIFDMKEISAYKTHAQ
jgi:hypothetical protein